MRCFTSRRLMPIVTCSTPCNDQTVLSIYTGSLRPNPWVRSLSKRMSCKTCLLIVVRYPKSWRLKTSTTLKAPLRSQQKGLLRSKLDWATCSHRKSKVMCKFQAMCPRGQAESHCPSLIRTQLIRSRRTIMCRWAWIAYRAHRGSLRRTYDSWPIVLRPRPTYKSSISLLKDRLVLTHILVFVRSQTIRSFK